MTNLLKIKNFYKISAVLVIIASFIFCLTSPIFAMANKDPACRSNALITSHNGEVNTNSACTEQHTELGQHAFNYIFSINLLIGLLAIIAVFLVFFIRKSIFSAIESYLTSIKFYWNKHRILIKPKLEKIYLRWLNLLGGTVVLSI